jgi:hypothetical protein
VVAFLVYYYGARRSFDPFAMSYHVIAWLDFRQRHANYGFKSAHFGIAHGSSREQTFGCRAARICQRHSALYGNLCFCKFIPDRASLQRGDFYLLAGCLQWHAMPRIGVTALVAPRDPMAMDHRSTATHVRACCPFYLRCDKHSKIHPRQPGCDAGQGRHRFGPLQIKENSEYVQPSRKNLGTEERVVDDHDLEHQWLSSYAQPYVFSHYHL